MKYFTEEEINCPCGCGATLSEETKEKLDKLRELYGKPIYVEQSATCEKYSVVQVGRKKTSTHIDNGSGGLAVDIKKKTFGSKRDYMKFVALAEQVGFTGFGQGIGWYDIHKEDKRLHLDLRDTSDIVTWVYY